MELLEFNDWTFLSESTSTVRAAKLFTIGPDFNKLVNDTYYQVADSMLKEHANQFEYELSQDTSNGDLTIIFKEDTGDEIYQSIFGLVESFSIKLKSLIYKDGYYGSSYYLVNYDSFPKAIARAFHNHIIEKTNDTIIIRIKPMFRDFDASFNETCEKIAIQAATESRQLMKPEEVTSSDYNTAFRQAELDKTGEGVEKFSKKLSQIIIYRTTLEVLSKISSDLNIDTDELSTNINQRLAEFTKIDLSNLSESDKETTLNEMLKFQKYLIGLSDPKKDIEGAIALSPLITMFRILLSEFGSALEIEKRLKSVTVS